MTGVAQSEKNSQGFPQHYFSVKHYNSRQETLWQTDFVLDDQPLSRRILTDIWSPIAFANNRRLGKNFLFADWLVLDIDNGMRIEEAAKKYCDMAHIIATTKSHTEQHHRFRICLLFEQRITDPKLYQYNVDLMIKDNDSDRSCKDLARAYFPCQEIFSVNRDIDSYLVEVEPLPENWASCDHSWDGSPEQLSRFALTTLMKRKVYALKPSRHETCWRLARDLLKTGATVDEVKGTIIKNIEFIPQLSKKTIDIRIQSALRSLEREVYGRKESDEEEEKRSNGTN